jgi:serine/threonine protein kinase
MNFPSNRYRGLHMPKLLCKEDENKLKNASNGAILSSLFISKRIGSDSQIGTVWLASLNSLSFVFCCKLQSNRDKAHNEFKILHHLSHKWEENFIRAYKCIDTEEGNLIFMEIAIGDLEQVIKYDTVTEQMLRGFVLDVIDSVEIMASEKVFHGDLHIRQILIVTRNSSKKAVIADFGEHVLIDSPTMHLSDLKTFFKSLLEVIHFQRSVSVIMNCLDFITRRITEIELNNSAACMRRDVSVLRKFFSYYI